MRKVLIVLACLMFCGCESAPEPDVTYCGNDLVTFSTSYFVDNQTGVVYMYVREGQAAGLTVMLNRDGSPVTREQLEL